LNFSEGIIFLSSVAPNVPEMIEDFLRYLQFEKRASDHTVGAYEQDLRSFQAFIRNTYQIENLETVDYGIVRSWIVQLVEEGLQPSSVNRKIASLRSFFKFLLKQEVIAKDPMLKIRVLKTRKKLPSFVKEHDMAAMLDHAVFENNFEGLRDRVMLELIRRREQLKYWESEIRNALFPFRQALSL
jgi:integrase/recombinase XerC